MAETGTALAPGERPGVIRVRDGRFDPATLRGVFGCFPSGVVAVCGLRDGVPLGLVASSYTSVSLEPPLVSVCVGKTSRTWPLLRGLPYVGLSVFGSGHEDVCRQMGKKDGDRFAGIGWWRSAGGGVLIDGAAAWLECELSDEVPAGDHDIALLRVRALESFPSTAPLVFHASRFRRLSAE